MSQHKDRHLTVSGPFRKNMISSVLVATVIAISPILASAYARIPCRAAQGESEPYVLDPDKPVKGEIASAERRSYKIALSSGKYLSVVFTKQNAELEAALFDPGHRKISSRSNPRRIVSLSLIAETTGIYTLEITLPGGHTEGRGSYELKIEQLRDSTPRDRRNILAQRACEAGDRLRTEWKAESFRKALKRYEEARSYWHSINNRLEEANTVKDIADIYLLLGENQKAIDYYNQALSLNGSEGDRELEIEIINGAGYAHIEIDESKKALEYCNKALALSREISYSAGEAQSLNNIGLVSYESSDMQKAIALFSQALSIRQSLGESRGQAETLTNLGYVYSDLGEIEKALTSFNLALSLWKDAKDRRGLALTLTAIGLQYTWLGKMQMAINSHDEAIELLRAMGDRNGEAISITGIGYLYDVLGEKQKALDSYSIAQRLYRALGKRSNEAITMGHIGRIYYSLGDKQKALDHFNRKLTISQALDDVRMQAYTFKDLGLIFDSLGDKKKALDYYDKALALSREVTDRRGQAQVLNCIGYFYDRAGEKRKALELYSAALELIRAAADLREETLTLHNLARVSRDLGDLNAAADQLKSLLKVVESTRTNVISQELRASYFASAHQHYELYIDVLMRMHKERPSGGSAAIAIEASERARARSLIELMIETGADIREGVDPILLQRERALQRLLNAKAEEHTELLSRRQAEEAAAIKQELTAIMTEYQDVRARIRATSPRYAMLTQPQPLSLTEMQDQLIDADTLLLEYWLGEERSYLWTITRSSVSSYELPDRATIEKSARRLYELLTSRNRRERENTAQQWQATPDGIEAQYCKEAARLSEMLLGPVASQLGTKRLAVVADGALQYIPFAALPDPAVVGPADKDRQPLIVNHEVISLPSISALAVLRREIAGRHPATKTVAILADPVFEKDDIRVAPTAAQGRIKMDTATKSLPFTLRQKLDRSAGDFGGASENINFQRLPFVREEAKTIAGLLPEGEYKLALDFAASRATAMSPEMAQYRIVHFATHGLLNSLQPELSGIVLSLVDEQGRRQDGFLRLHDIYNLRLPANIVVLSACETALGKDVKGEGLVGLTRGFMYAGAERVVATLWKVDDKASAELMKHFYQEMLGQNRQRPAAALRAAQIEIWKQGQWKSPYYWAAFILQGEWK